MSEDGIRIPTIKNFCTFAELFRPVGIQIEVERVEDGGHIATHARIAICSPCATYAVELLVYLCLYQPMSIRPTSDSTCCEVVESKLMLQSVAHGYAGRTGADDDDLWGVHCNDEYTNEV